MDGFAGKVAVVTGAGSGIGRALALELARSGARLAVSDLDVDGLGQTEELIRRMGAPVRADRLDVTEREAFLAYADTVNAHFGIVHQIYNIAGIAFLGDVEVSRFKDIEKVMDVDYWGVVNGTKAFLPHLIASGDGHVVNMSSMFGLFGVPGQAAYNSAQVRGARFLRGAAPGDGDRRPSGRRHGRASRLRQDGDRGQRRTCRRPRQGNRRAGLQQGRHHQCRTSRADHPEGGPQEEGAGGGGAGRQSL